MNSTRFGKYDVLRKIASGGMAEVYLCRLSGEEGFRKRVALKVVHPRLSGDPRFREMFAREARLAASLSHPNLVQVFDFGREGEALFLAMEHVDGWNLAQAAAQAAALGMAVPPGIWRHWVEGIWTGIEYLHGKGIVHRDLSPSNVLVARNGVVKITDFGISRGEEERRGSESRPAGKSGYLAPERHRGEDAGRSSDLFAAGVISVELILGRRMFGGDRPEDARERILNFDAEAFPLPPVPAGMERLLRKSVAGSPRDRYASAGAFLADLAREGPAAASAAERTAFWDALFPALPEEETAPDLSGDPLPASAMVKEPAERYGASGRKMQVGAAVVFAAVAVGGVLLWKETRQPAERDNISSRPASSVSPVLPSDTDGSRDTAIPPGTGSRPVPPGRIRETAKEREEAAISPVLPSVPAVPREPAPVRLARIETDPAGASVAVEGGATLGKTPMQIDLAILSGRKLTVSKEGFERQSIPAEALAAGQVFRAELQPLTGTVGVIQAIPWAKVYLGNRLLGETPLTAVRLPAGEQRLRFVNEPLGIERVEILVIRPGENPKIIVPMASGRRPSGVSPP
ncbi:MAG: hypothetical protein OHK0028_16290 [Deltaproteobacteria bacterium]